MGTKKKTEPQVEESLKDEIVEAPQQEAPSKPEEKEAVLPPEIDNLLRLYPQYQKLWVTRDGFVHPEGVSKALVEDAVLYENKYYEPYND